MLIYNYSGQLVLEILLLLVVYLYYRKNKSKKYNYEILMLMFLRVSYYTGYFIYLIFGNILFMLLLIGLYLVHLAFISFIGTRKNTFTASEIALWDIDLILINGYQVITFIISWLLFKFNFFTLVTENNDLVGNVFLMSLAINYLVISINTFINYRICLAIHNLNTSYNLPNSNDTVKTIKMINYGFLILVFIYSIAHVKM